MTPTAKALALIARHYEYVDNKPFEWCAKQTALITVDEILNTIYNEDFSGHLIDENDAASYWNEVKAEIEKL